MDLVPEVGFGRQLSSRHFRMAVVAGSPSTAELRQHDEPRLPCNWESPSGPENKEQYEVQQVRKYRQSVEASESHTGNLP